MLGVSTKVKQVCGDQQKVENQTTGLGQHKFEVRAEKKWFER